MRYAILGLFRRLGYDVQRYKPHDDPMRRFQYALARRNAETVIDVGANVGQFGQRLRINGYQGRIISIEPTSAAHAAVSKVAKHDPRWMVTERCALGATSGEAVEINIAANSQSSSMLGMLDRHVAGDPHSGYVSRETVPLMTLDSLLDRHIAVTSPSMGLKIDTQGYEAQVLSGLRRWDAFINVIQLEMSLTKLYEGSLSFIELYRIMEDRGFRCISIDPNFTDPHTYEMLQTDAIFERDK